MGSTDGCGVLAKEEWQEVTGDNKTQQNKTNTEFWLIKLIEKLWLE